MREEGDEGGWGGGEDCGEHGGVGNGLSAGGGGGMSIIVEQAGAAFGGGGHEHDCEIGRVQWRVGEKKREDSEGGQ